MKAFNKVVGLARTLLGRDIPDPEIPPEVAQSLAHPDLPDLAASPELPEPAAPPRRRALVVVAVVVSAALGIGGGIGGGYWYGVETTSDRYLTEIRATSKKAWEHESQQARWLDRDVCVSRAQLAAAEEEGRRPFVVGLEEDPVYLRCVADQRQEVEELRDRLERIDTGDAR